MTNASDTPSSSLAARPLHTRVGPLLMAAGAVGLAIWGTSLIRVFELLTVTTANLPWAGVPGGGAAMISGVVFALGATLDCRYLAGTSRQGLTAAAAALVVLAGILQCVAAGLLLTGIFAQRASFRELASAEGIPSPEVLQAGVAWSATLVQIGWVVLAVAAAAYLTAGFLSTAGRIRTSRPQSLLNLTVIVGCVSALAFAAGWLLAWQQMQALREMLEVQLPKPVELASRLNTILLDGMLIGGMLAGIGFSTIVAGIVTRRETPA